MLGVIVNLVMERRNMSDEFQQPTVSPDERHDSPPDRVIVAVYMLLAAIAVMIIVLAIAGPAIGNGVFPHRGASMSQFSPSENGGF
jgi:hypothetical protein